jgi:N-acetylmuramoyl-L-alanine amidase
MTTPPAPVPVHRRGDRGAAVAAIRTKLAVLGLLPEADLVSGTPDDAAFDRDCELAVRRFQQDRGITADGVVGPATYRALDEARWRFGDRILRYSVGATMSGDDVAVLQHRLLDMGFDCGRADGIFGPETDTALRDFQRNVGVVVDGTCGPATMRAFERLARTVVGGRPHALREHERIHRAGPALSDKLIILDPGHGGSDRGVVAGGLDEAGVVEDLAARIEGRLTATGVLAFLSRGADLEYDETERAAFANAAEADLLISLHCDGTSSAHASGVATYFYGREGSAHYSDVGERLADLVRREIVARTDLVDCGTHPKTWDILRRTRMPAVRLEIGYLTNAGDAARLADPSFRDTVAEAVVAAVQRLYLPPEDDADTGSLRVPLPLSDLALR